MLKKILNLSAMLFTAWPFLWGQGPLADSFPVQKAQGIISVLAGDSLRGRGNMTTDLLKAGQYILRKFRETGLQPLPGMTGLFHTFQPGGGPGRRRSNELQWNGKKVKPRHFRYLAAQPGTYSSRNLHDFTIIQIDSFSANTLETYKDFSTDLLLWTASRFNNWEELNIPAQGLAAARLLVCSPAPPGQIILKPDKAFYRSAGYNIIGILPGKTRPGEYILFSAHYDHLGIAKAADSVMNGANDNASGSTALIMLAEYFAMRNDNARTLIFCAFAGEETGLNGSSALAKLLSPSSLKAVINLEMLGLPQYGPGTVYITGEKYSSLPAILKNGFKEQGIRLVPEPSEEKMLFARSDNYPVILRGIPAHTIMASDDEEPCYHKPCDEVGRMDLGNLCLITRAVAFAAGVLVSGKETPGDLYLPDW